MEEWTCYTSRNIYRGKKYFRGFLYLVQKEKVISGFTEVEILVMELTDVMTRDVQVPDALYDQVKAHFNDREILEVVTTIAAYNMVSRLLNALHVGH